MSIFAYVAAISLFVAYFSWWFGTHRFLQRNYAGDRREIRWWFAIGYSFWQIVPDIFLAYEVARDKKTRLSIGVVVNVLSCIAFVVSIIQLFLFSEATS